MREKVIYFLGLSLLIAGIVFLNAQEEEDSANGAGQSAPATEPIAPVSSPVDSNASAPVETTAVPAGEVTATAVPVASSQAETTSAGETNALASGAPAEEKKEPAAEQSEKQPQPETSAAAEKKPALDDAKALDFEIDRGNGAPKTAAAAPAATSAVTTGRVTAPVLPAAGGEEKTTALEQTSTAGEQKILKEARPAAAEKASMAEKSEKKGIFRRLFGSKKESKQSAQTKGAETAREEAAPDETTAREMTSEQLLAAQEEVRRQAKEVDGLKKLDQAYLEMSRNEFVKALKYFNEALTIMPVRPHTVETRQKAMQGEAECEYRLALNDYKAGKIAETRQGISRALEYYPAHAGAVRLSEQIRRDEQRRVQKEAQPVPARLAPGYLAKQKRIKGELKRGLEYMDLKEYDKAENEFNSILAEDKLDADASAGLRKVAEARYKLESDEFDRLKAEMLTQIKNTWIPPVKKVLTGQAGPGPETVSVSPVKKRLEDKLKNIIIPELKFNEANIEDVIEYLHQQSIAGDKDSPPGERGVNIILQTKPGEAGAVAPAAAAAGASASDLFSTEEAKPAGGASGGMGTKISLSVRGITLQEALKYITEFTGYKYHVEERAVIIHRADTPYGKLQTRTYKVQPSIVETFMGGAGSAPAAESDKLEISSAGPVTAERKDMKLFFVNAGVPFPEGTSITYIPAQTLLIVKNTAENLEAFEDILNKLNVPTILVEIEARFVEIGQADLEELGLEWILTDNWELAEKSSGLPKSMRERIQMNKGPITKGLRELDSRLGVSKSGGQLGNIASISSILTNPELTVILHALQQKDGANLLSAPKVTTKSGSPAEIKVVKEWIYPTEYQQQAQSIGTTSSGNQSLVQIVVTPSAFETRDIGVILGVTPTVGPDNETIDLAMTPQVVELAEWKDYDYVVPTADPARSQTISYSQPIFHSRSITTAISIYDGQTVVMGGLITEVQINSEDKIPLLGDIPMLGYLFKTKTSRSEKRNLLIFVSASLVDPGGNKIKKEKAVILPSGATASAAP